MVERRLTAWLRTALALLGIAGIVALAGCGGGSGAPNNPYTPPPPVIPDLKLYPAVATVYPGSPITLTVYGGVPPYRAFTTNATVLPVTNAVSGDTIVLLANPVSELTVVNVGVLDAVGSIFEQDSVITVQPAPLLPSNITVTANPNPACDGTDGNLCSGGTGTATVKVTGPGGVGIKGRSVKFDVVQGSFSIVSTNPAQPLVSTLTVVTDVNGNAVVVLSVPADTPTQTGIIRATDLTTGSQITGSFKILQVTTGGAVLSVLPLGATTINGPDNQTCSSGVTVTNYIYGGTPPYQVAVNFPQVVTLSGVPVLKSGGAFSTTTNGKCFINLTYVITDATGRTIPGGSYPTVTNQLGTGAPIPAPTTLVATPGAIAKANCVPSNTFQFLLTGGIAPYSVVTSSTNSLTSVVLSPQTGIASGQAVTVNGITSPATTSITAYDSSTPRQSTTVSIDCTGAPPPTPPATLVIAPINFNYAATTCVNQTSNFAVTGGTPPYNVFFASPRPGATISPSTLTVAGQGFSVTGLTNGVLTTNITVVDSSTPALQSVATITCPTTPNVPALVITPPNFNYTSTTCVNQTSNFVVTGGTAPYSVFFASPRPGATISPTTLASSGQGFSVTGLTNGVLTTNITVVDSTAIPLQSFATITCPITTPTGPLTVTPGNAFVLPPLSCVGQTFNWVITGGTPPYTVAFPTPPNAGGAITPSNVNFSGGGFSVTGLRDTTSSPNPGQLLTNVSITDSASVPAIVIRSVTCP